MFLSPFALDRTRPHRFLYPFPCVTYRLTRILYLYCLNYYFICLSVLAEINQHNGKIFPDRYQWDFYGTLLVKVLYRAPSLITHTILRTDLMPEGAVLVLQSVPRTVCVATSKYLSTPVVDYRGQRYLSLSWSALCFYLGTQLPDNSRINCRLLGLRLFIIRRPDYPDAPYRKFLGLRYLTTWVPGRRDLDTQILGRTQSSWSALIYYVNARLHGRTRNDRLLVGPVAPNYVCYR